LVITTVIFLWMPVTITMWVWTFPWLLAMWVLHWPNPITAVTFVSALLSITSLISL
jgi:hypothetical protein